MIVHVCSAAPAGWIEDNGTLLAWLGGLSIASLVLCALLLPVFVARLPADYFARHREEPAQKRTGWALTVRILKNLAGVVFVLAGIAMLLLPGQGVLTMLIGLLLVEFPGKRGLERRLVRRPKMLRLLNRMREKRGKPPLRVD